MLEISLLGPPRIRRDGEPVSFDTRKATALLAHLALAERARSREALCELLWPDQDPEHARGALRRTLSAVRKAVGEEWMDTTGDSVALRPGASLDVASFRSLSDAGELEAAVEVFRGELLEGFYLKDSPGFDAWQVREADALQRELGSALGKLVRSLSETGQYGKGIRFAQRWLALDSLHEPAHRELIRLYALDGDRAAALAQYRDCVRTLSQELGVPPVDETAALFEQVSEGTLTAPVAAPVVAAPAPVVAPPDELPLVGRATELAMLSSAVAGAVIDGRVVVVEGEAGIGKSRLARELLATVGGVVLTARCHEDEAGLPYGPIVELLAEAARLSGLDSVPAQRLADASLLAPELARPNLPPPMEMSGPAAQTRLLDAITAVLGVARVVFVDDVHAADEATLDVLAYLGRRLRGRPLVLLLCVALGASDPGTGCAGWKGPSCRSGAWTRPRWVSWCARARSRPTCRSGCSWRVKGCRCSSPSTWRRWPRAARRGVRCATSWPRAWPGWTPRRASCSRRRRWSGARSRSTSCAPPPGAATRRRRTRWRRSSAAGSCARSATATSSPTASCASSSTSRPAARAGGCCTGARRRRCCAPGSAPRPPRRHTCGSPATTPPPPSST